MIDFQTAFPSIGHDWLWAVLERMQLPLPLLCLIKALYHNLVTQLSLDGEIVGTVRIASGIKQGCPLSGTLFALGLDPLIRRYLSSVTFASSRICAFADDLALVLASLRRQLPEVISLFGAWAIATGLALRAGKCVLILLRRELLPADLAAEFPELAGVAIQDSGCMWGRPPRTSSGSRLQRRRGPGSRTFMCFRRWYSCARLYAQLLRR